MKYLLILVLASSPLVALTAWTFYGLFTGSYRPADVVDTPPASRSKIGIAETQKRAEADGPLLEEFAAADLLGVKPRDLPPTASAQFEAAVGHWRQSQEARSLVQQFAALGQALADADQPAVPKSKAQAEDLLRQISQFVAENRPKFAARVPQSEALFKHLESRADQLNREIAGYRNQEEAAAMLAKAQEDLKAGRYRDSLSALDKVRSLQPDAAIGSFRNQAEYLAAWQDLSSRVPAGPADRELLKSLDEFLRVHAEVPTPAEEPIRQQARKWQFQLQTAAAIEDLLKVDDFDRLLAQAAVIAANKDIGKSDKDRVREHVSRWLAIRAFPSIEPPAGLAGKKEAVTKNGQRKIGVFFLPPGAEQWRFWTDDKSRAERPRGDEQIGRDSLVAPPAVPKYVQWAERYRVIVAKLTAQGGNRRQWQEFARWCDEHEEQLVAYRQQWGIEGEPDRSCRDWSFRNSAATARKLADRWDEIRPIWGK